MSEIHFDYETTSACDIALGSYRYGSDPSTRILMFAVAGETGEPFLWDFTDPFSDESLAAEALLQKGIRERYLLYAHNVNFEIPLTTYRLETDVGISPPEALDRYRCTLAMCRRAAAPESLAAAAEFFGLSYKKDSIGRSLIDIFSIQTKPVTLFPPTGMKDPKTIKLRRTGGFTQGKKPANRTSYNPVLDEEILWDWQVKVNGNLMTVRVAWDTFCTYCRNDVKVERELHRKLKRFELKGDELASFQFDLRMNFRGVPVNMEALKNADALVNAYREKLETRITQNTGGITPGQRARMLEWLQERGYPEKDLQAGTVDRILENPPAEMTPLALEILRTRSLLSFSALKKIPTMINAAGPDHRVRGTTQWHAARTGRAGGRIIQPQNFKKATSQKDSEFCYRMIRENWTLDWFEELWRSPLEEIAKSIRHFIQPHSGKILDADFVGVEARITPWLSGDTKKLQIILDGVDLYKRMAALLFSVDYDVVTKGQRTDAKPVELGCCFGVGGRGLREAMALPPYNLTRTLQQCKDYVKIYRDSHPETVQAWADIEDAARSSITQAGKPFTACDGKLEFLCGRAAGIDYLTMRLPSGRRLYYPKPQVKPVFKKYDAEEMEEDFWKKEKGGYWIEQISFYGKLRETNNWGRVGTWGSRLFENAVQAIGADLLNHGCVKASEEGYEIFLIIHDQALAHDGLPLEGFLKALCHKQPWAESFPLEADGAVHPYYLKED